MLTEVLDSNPGADICFPSHIQFNCTPAYKGKVKGQPLLGHGQRKYTHFISMRGAADHVKDLLEIPDTDSTLHPPVEAAKELLKEEKIVKGEDQKADDSADLVSPKFKKDAQEYMENQNAKQEESYTTDQYAPMTTSAKTDSEVATIIAAAKKPSRPRPRCKTPKKEVKNKNNKVKKKTAEKSKKMSNFRIAKSRK